MTWGIDGCEAAPLLTHSVEGIGREEFGDPERGDHAVVASLLWAMQNAERVAVEGRVSPSLLERLETLQESWHRWRPERYRVIPIAAEEESEVVPPSHERPAVFAFSGGVDGCYSFFRHLHSAVGRRSCRPGACMLVHGMDIPLREQAVFERAAARAVRMLDGAGVPLLKVRTNSRTIGQRWEDSFGLQFSACFLLFQHRFSRAIRASGETYESLLFPWGSTPLTDPLTGTRIMEIVHDGCEADRTEKIKWLAENTNVCEELRVCWEGEHLDRNCGQCEKCVRTMMNFWALRLPVPAAFPNELTPELVRSVRPRNRVQLAELENLLRHAEENVVGPRDPVRKALAHVIARESRAARLARLSRVARRALGRS